MLIRRASECVHEGGRERGVCVGVWICEDGRSAQTGEQVNVQVCERHLKFVKIIIIKKTNSSVKGLKEKKCWLVAIRYIHLSRCALNKYVLG